MQWPLIHLSLLFCLSGAPVIAPFTVTDLLSKLDAGLRTALYHMNGRSYALPFEFNKGGGCYTGFGNTLRVPDCQHAMTMIPGLRFGDISYSPQGILVLPEFHLENPMVWSYGFCSVGVSIRKTYVTKGLYPTFWTAAHLILEKCVAKAHGGMVRFGYFEVVIFDSRLLPQTGPNYITNFFSNVENLPLSNGLRRLWRAWTMG